MLEVLKKVSWIQFQNEAASINNKFEHTDFRFPRSEKRNDKQQNLNFDFPNDSDLNNILQKAKEAAFNEVQLLGMSVQKSDADSIILLNKLNKLNKAFDNQTKNDFPTLRMSTTM